ncbi:hypothetical protein MRY82_08180 [bacterium]|nr:hypothetical protein [bacterium]
MNKKFGNNMHELAKDALNRFMNEALLNYAHQRNFDLGKENHNNVSRLSHFIRKRLISEERVVKKILSSFDLGPVEKYIQEVCWRTYWKGWLCHYPSVWDNYRSELDQLLKNADAITFSKIKDLEMSNSEFECLNDWSEELQETGYLHNHARMWFASIWVHTLQLPWQLGAHFFMQHLLDGDEASNTLSWRWVAGLHTKGKAYLASAKNIKKFTHSRYEKIPEMAARAVQLEYQAPSFENIELKSPANTKGKVHLLVHGNDLESLGALVKRYKPEVIYILSLRHLNKQLKIYSEKVLKFDDQALEQTLHQLSLSQDFKVISIEDDISFDQNVDYVSYFPGQGYMMDYLQDKIPNLKYVYKPWDQKLFPYANKGFFPFWKKVKQFLKQEDI